MGRPLYRGRELKSVNLDGKTIAKVSRPLYRGRELKYENRDLSESEKRRPLYRGRELK